MGKSFVLKDSCGAVRGYLVSGMGKLRCRINERMAQGQLVLLFADGGIARHALTADGEEQTLPDGGREIGGAAVCEGDTPVLYTDERARADCVRLQSRKGEAGQAAARQSAPMNRQAEQEERQERRAEQITENKAEAQDEPDRARDEERVSAECLPQRRWPPPACWPEARYAHGRWQEQEE